MPPDKVLQSLGSPGHRWVPPGSLFRTALRINVEEISSSIQKHLGAFREAPLWDGESVPLPPSLLLSLHAGLFCVRLHRVCSLGAEAAFLRISSPQIKRARGELLQQGKLRRSQPQKAKFPPKRFCPHAEQKERATCQLFKSVNISLNFVFPI